MILEDLSEEQLEELYMCAQCGYCRVNCPAYDPVGWESVSPSGKIYFLKSLTKSSGLRNFLFGPKARVDERFVQRVYECCMCGRCEEVCQVGIKLYELWKKTRESLVRKGVGPKVASMLDSAVQENNNVYNMDHSQRLEWTEYAGIDVPILDKADTVWFLGCTLSYIGRLQPVAEAVTTILNHAEENWTLLGENEYCCGHPLVLIGALDRVREVMEHNVEAIEARGAKTVVTSCPGCYLAFKEEYPEVVGKHTSFEVIHLTQLLEEYMEKGKIKLEKLDVKATYHDPCELGRLGDILDAPRNVLKRIVTDFVEPPETGMLGHCCGAGGGLKGYNLQISQTISDTRLNMLLGTGAQLCISACPSCDQSLGEASMRRENPIRVVDIAQLVAEQLE